MSITARQNCILDMNSALFFIYEDLKSLYVVSFLKLDKDGPFFYYHRFFSANFVGKLDL